MKELLEKLENLPSILNIEYELFFIDRLQTLPIDEISKKQGRNIMNLPYKPQDIRNFFAYSYEFIDCLDFMRNPYDIIENYIEYEKFIIERIKNIRILDNFHFELSDTDSYAIQAMWIPPFAIVGILVNGLIQFENKQGIYFSINEQEQCDLDIQTDKRWTMGLVLFHVKNIKSGESLILSPFQLSIPDYGLE